MRLIEPSVEIINQEGYTEVDLLKHVEKCARTCYKSECKISEDSYISFCDMLKKREHLAVFEHATVYLHFAYVRRGLDKIDNIQKYVENPYSKVNYSSGDITDYYITTNLRVVIENGWEDDLLYLCKPTEHHYKRYTVKFVLSRAIANQFIRHRVFSFAQESQRYCNYSLSKFDNEITFIIPSWVDTKVGTDDSSIVWSKSMKDAENAYFELIRAGKSPQDAREVLPNSCKTELVMTGFKSDWEHFFKLRCDLSAHPEARKLSIELERKFIEDKVF